MPLPWLITRDYLLWQIEIEIFPTHFVGVAPSVNSPHSHVGSNTALASVSGHCHFTNMPHGEHTYIHTDVCSTSYSCVFVWVGECKWNWWRFWFACGACVSCMLFVHINHSYTHAYMYTIAVSCSHSLTAGIGRTFTPNACWVTVKAKAKNNKKEICSLARTAFSSCVIRRIAVGILAFITKLLCSVFILSVLSLLNSSSYSTTTTTTTTIACCILMLRLLLLFCSLVSCVLYMFACRVSCEANIFTSSTSRTYSNERPSAHRLARLVCCVQLVGRARSCEEFVGCWAAVAHSRRNVVIVSVENVAYTRCCKYALEQFP